MWEVKKEWEDMLQELQDVSLQCAIMGPIQHDGYCLRPGDVIHPGDTQATQGCLE